MRRQAFRPIAATLCVLLAVAAPARAATITFTEVVRTAGVMGGSRSAAEVRLRVMAQSGNRVALVQTSAPTQPDSQQPSQQPATQPDTTTAQPSAPSPTDPTLSQSGGQVETVDLGDVTGTVCDCGEIPAPPIPKGGIPWWLGFAGIPLICVSGICFDDDTRRPPPSTPTPTPEVPIPEPATLILFGSGLLALGARARRRLGRKQLENEAAIAAAAEEV